MKYGWIKRVTCLLLVWSLCLSFVPVASAAELAAPTNVRWSTDPPGCLTWDAVEGAEYYVISLHTSNNMIMEYYSDVNYCFLNQEDIYWESGTYQASVQALVWDENGNESTSEAAMSDEFVYTDPGMRLDTPSNLRWEGTTAKWDAVEGENILYRFTLYVDFGYEYWEPYISFVTNLTEDDVLSYVMEELIDMGAVAYGFEILAISPDITACQNSWASDIMPYSDSGGTEPNIPVTGISLNFDEQETAALGQLYVASVTFAPVNATNRNFTLTSSDPNVAEIVQSPDFGWGVRCVGVGTAVITATSEDGGFTAVSTFTVRAVMPESLTLVKGSSRDPFVGEVKLFVGDILDLATELTPDNISNDQLIWEISDPSVISFETWDDSAHYGQITALASGTATVTVKSEADSSICDSLSITVSEFGGVTEAPLSGGLWSDYCAAQFSDYDPANRKLTIWSAEELALLAVISRDIGIRQLTGFTIKLGCNIYLDGRYWVPGGDALSGVTFDGDGHTIYGLTVVDSELAEAGYDAESLGLFGNDSDLVIKNLTIKDAKIIGENVLYAGVFAGQCRSLTNCKTLHSTVNVRTTEDHGWHNVGGLVGRVNEMEDCRSDFGSLTVDGSQAGGLAGSCETATLCDNNSDITARNSFVGGLFYEMHGDINQCTNKGTITVYDSTAAGITHYFSGDTTREPTMEYCYNLGDIVAPGSGAPSRLAGLVAFNSFANIYNCSNLGNLQADTYSSSAAGLVHQVSGTVLRCKSEGTLTATYVSGIANEVCGTVKSCRNNATLIGDMTGGIAYRVDAGGTVDSCENTADITSEGYAVGGIVYENTGLVNTCVNYGDIVSAGHAGGIAYDNEGTIKGCGNYASIRTTNYRVAVAGGIAAYITNYSSGLTPRFEGCENHGSVTALQDIAGGIVGEMFISNPELTILSCRNSGTISSGRQAGGIVGYTHTWENGSLVIDQCENTGTIRAIGSSANGSIAGIIGYASCYESTQPNPLLLINVHNDALVKNDASNNAFLGGIVGSMNMGNAPWPLANAFSSGTVRTASDRDTAGALVGTGDYGNPSSSAPSYYRKSGSLPAIGSGYSPVSQSKPATVGLTSAQMANTSSFASFDFDGIWDMADHPQLRMSELESARESGATYYTEISDRLFRISVPGSGYPAPSGFTVTSAEGTRHSGGGADVNFPLTADNTDPIVFSKTGYHTYEMPRRLAQRYNVVTMVPDSVTTPFIQSILLKKSYSGGGYSYENLRSGIISVYTMNVAEAENYEGEIVYVDVNWNGHEEGSIWLEQNGKKLYLADDVFSDVEMGKYFQAGSPVYVCVGDENGTYYRTRTTIQLVYNPNQIKVDFPVSDVVSPGNNPKDDGELDFLLGQSLSIDFEAIEDKLKFTFEVKDDGSFKGIMGTTLKHGEKNNIDTVYRKIDEMQGAFFDSSFSKTPAGQKMIEAFKKDPNLSNGFANLGIKGDAKFVVLVAGRFPGNGDIEFEKMSFLIWFEGEVKFQYTSYIPVGPVTVPIATHLGLKGEANTGMNLTYNTEKKNLDVGAANIDAVLKLFSRIGPGVAGKISVQLAASGGVHMVVPFETVSGWIPTFSAIADLGFHGTLGRWEGDWVILEFPEHYFWKDGKFCWEKVPQTASLKFVPRLVSGSYSSAFISLLNMESTADVFKSGVSSIARPQLAILSDGTRILAWLDYANDGRGAADGYGIYYSVCKNNTWSDPVLLDNDQTADGTFIMENLNDSVYLAWQDLDKSFGDSYPQTSEGEDDIMLDMLSTDISAARFDPTSRQFTDLVTFSAPNAMDSLPVLAAAEGGIALGWRTADEECLRNLTDNGFGQFRFAVFAEEKWNQVFTRTDTPAWYTEEKLPADVEDIDSYLGSGYAYAAQGDLQAAVFPMRDEETNTYGIYGCFHDGGAWGEPILLSNLDYDTIVTDLSAAFAPDGYLNIAASRRYIMADGSYARSADLLTLRCDPENDLALTEADYNRETLIPGADLELELSVRNLGPRQENAFRVTVRNGGEQLVQEMVYESIPSGAEGTLYVSCPLPAEDAWGDLSALTVTVDSLSWDDADTASNTAECVLRMTDASIEKVYACEGVNPETGTQETTVSVWVVNRGLEPLTNVALTLYGDLDRQRALTTVSVLPNAIGPGEAELCTIVTEELAGGDYVLVDAAIENTEENITSNNTDFGVVMEMRKPGALLVRLESPHRNEEGHVIATVTAENTGEEDAVTTLILAAYQGGRMVAVKDFPAICVSGYNVSSNPVDLGKLSGAVELRLFTLRGDGSYTPTEEVITDTVT